MFLLLPFSILVAHGLVTAMVTAEPTMQCTLTVLNLKIDTSSPIPTPTSFMGLSWEPLYSVPSLLTRPEFQLLIQRLSTYDTGPFVLRFGGGSQEFTSWSKLELGEDVWRELGTFHHNTKSLYILGLNVIGGNASLARAQVQNALRFIPSEAVISWGLGNEPEQ